uniref:Uncharacterized protein n=1 Tax=Kalanchoe fedtschenkoi TaxID=63787 RepID=A0A7N0U422_KALFE
MLISMNSLKLINMSSSLSASMLVVWPRLVIMVEFRRGDLVIAVHIEPFENMVELLDLASALYDGERVKIFTTSAPQQ